MSIVEDSSDHPTVDLRSLQLLQDAAHKITSMLDLEPLLETIVGEVAKTLGCNRSAVLLRDVVSDELELVAVRGWTIHVHPKGFRFKIGRDGLVGQAADRGVTIYVPDVRDSPDYIVSEETTRSEIDIPLRIRGRTIGVFNVQHSEVDVFPESQRKVLEALAGHIAIAVENARLFGHEKLARENWKKRISRRSGYRRPCSRSRALLFAVLRLRGSACRSGRWEATGSTISRSAKTSGASYLGTFRERALLPRF